jgi:hypothetical protein
LKRYYSDHVLRILRAGAAELCLVSGADAHRGKLGQVVVDVHLRDFPRNAYPLRPTPQDPGEACAEEP